MRRRLSALAANRRPRLQAAAAVGVMVVVAGTSGCALIFKNPSVTIADVTVSAVGLTGATAQVALEVANPNGYALTAEAVSYRLSFADALADEGWRTLAEGETDQRVVIAAHDTTQVRLSVPFTYASLGRALQNLLSSGTLPYRLDGDVKIDAPGRDVRVSFDRRGSLEP
jgi:LEA14-like dessication related protein